MPNQFNGSISKCAVNLKKIGRGQIFDLSRDPLTPRPDRAKISHFQNLFRFTQYGCHSFSVDASRYSLLFLSRGVVLFIEIKLYMK